MSILFVLLTFLLIITVTYFVKGKDEVLQASAGAQLPSEPRMRVELGFEIPKDYSFHPGHTWAVDEGRQNARVGLDSFTANLLGKIDRVEVVGVNRWVRQGQKLMSVTSGETTFDMLSPAEGIVMSVNPEVVKDPNLLVSDPYKNGWIATIKSPDLSTNMRNLVTGPLVAPWMQNTLGRLSTMAAQSASPMPVAADGGMPISGLLARLDPVLQRRVIHEFFLT
jgi:glycine cleavage system H protein